MSISAVRPVSPVRYTDRPLVNFRTNPFAGSRYADRPSLVSSVFSGSDTAAAAALLSWLAGTVAISTPDPPIVTTLEPLIPRSATHGPGRGTVISLKPKPGGPGGHEGVGTPVIARTFFPMKFARLGAATTAAFFAAAIAGVDPRWSLCPWLTRMACTTSSLGSVGDTVRPGS